MKKTITVIALIITILLSLCACGEIKDTSNSQGSNIGGGTINSSTQGNLDSYNVEIKSCRFATDYSGAQVVIIDYQFTNNGDNAISFTFALDCNVYQNGIGLNKCYFVSESANYSSENQTKEIKKGSTISVEEAYVLNDSTTDIEVEVSALFSLSNKKITRIFTIK